MGGVMKVEEMIRGRFDCRMGLLRHSQKGKKKDHWRDLHRVFVSVGAVMKAVRLEMTDVSSDPSRCGV